MKLFVVLILAVFSGSSFSYAADFDSTDPSTWNESHKIAARFEYCTAVIRSICPKNVSVNGPTLGNPFAEKKHECPFFTDKLSLAKTLLREQSSKKQRHQNIDLKRVLNKDIQRAITMKTLDIPLTAYDNCQNDVEEFLADKYKPTFNLKTFND